MIKYTMELHQNILRNELNQLKQEIAFVRHQINNLTQNRDKLNKRASNTRLLGLKSQKNYLLSLSKNLENQIIILKL